MSERTPLYLALLLASLVVGLILLREPLFGPYTRMADEIATLRAEADGLDKEIRERSGGRAELSDLLDAYGMPLEAGERSMAAAAFYSRLEGLASGCQLKVESVAPKPEVLTEDGLLKFGVTVNLAGDTQGVVAFLAQIQASANVVGIDRLTVRRRDAAERPLTMQVQLTSFGIADRATRRELAQAQAKKAAERRKTNGSTSAGPAGAAEGEKTP
ncbi:MAG: hypothetical protein HZB16_12045 [Armatimonadetes bacterium]|nr:hypothetical protein [Armatimonadota bacterium]